MSIFANIKSNNALGGTLLITGCCIGAGMIGLPVVSAFAGLIPSTLAMLLCYLFTTATGLLLLEATLWFDQKVNLLSIAEFAFGKLGKTLTAILFLFLFYCLFVAYLDAGGALFSGILSSLFHHTVSNKFGIIFCAALVASITYAGTRIIDNLNYALLIGLAASYLILVFFGLPNVDPENLKRLDWSAATATVPILLICFGYQNLVPSITYYLKKNINAIRFAIIIGNLIPFFIYFLWNTVILGLLNHIDSTTLKQADMVTNLLQHSSQSLSVIFFVKSFSLFAILTSFLPNAISFIDFLKDGIKQSSMSHKQEIALYGIVFIPALICALFYPHLFLQALSFAGGFIDVLLFGVLPASAVLVGRYIKKASGPYQIAGGGVTPMVILTLSVAVLFLKFALA